MKNIALILAGGRGKRFWPHSRFNKPKQLLASPSGNSMLRDTFERLLTYFETDDIYVATIEDLFQPIRQIIPEIDILLFTSTEEGLGSTILDFFLQKNQLFVLKMKDLILFLAFNS